MSITFELAIAALSMVMLLIMLLTAIITIRALQVEVKPRLRDHNTTSDRRSSKLLLHGRKHATNTVKRASHASGQNKHIIISSSIIVIISPRLSS